MNSIRIYYSTDVYSLLETLPSGSSKSCSLCKRSPVTDLYFKVSLFCDYHGSQYICKCCLTHIIPQSEYDMLEALNLIPRVTLPGRLTLWLTEGTPYIERTISDTYLSEMARSEIARATTP